MMEGINMRRRRSEAISDKVRLLRQARRDSDPGKNYEKQQKQGLRKRRETVIGPGAASHAHLHADTSTAAFQVEKLKDLSQSIKKREEEINLQLSKHPKNEQHVILLNMYKERKARLEALRATEEEEELTSGRNNNNNVKEDDVNAPGCSMCSYLQQEFVKYKQTEEKLKEQAAARELLLQRQLELEAESESNVPESKYPLELLQERFEAEAYDRSSSRRHVQTTEDYDPFMVECVECGKWVVATTHKNNLAIGYCCSNILVSRIER